MPLSFFDRETSALATLQEAIRKRVAAEADLALNFQTASEKAERDVNRARKQVNAAREVELAALDAAHTKDAAEINGRFDSEVFALNRGREEKRQASVTRYKAAEEKGKSEYKDRLWSLDSLFEGGEKKAKDQLETLQRKAEAGKERVVELWAESEAPLARGKVTRAKIELPNIGAPLTDDDPITAMQKSLDASAAALNELKGLPFPRLANFGGLLLCLILAGGLGSIAFAAMEPIAATGVALGVGIVLGFGLWLVITLFAHKQTLRVGLRLGEELVLAEGRCVALEKFAKREYDEELERLTERHVRKKKETDNYYLPMFAKQKQQHEEDLARIVEEHAAATEDATRRHEAEASAEASSYQARRSDAVAKFDAQWQAAEDAFNSKMGDATADRDEAWAKLADDWRTAIGAVKTEVVSLRREGETLFPPFQASKAASRVDLEATMRGTMLSSRTDDEQSERPLPTTVPDGVRIGAMHLDLDMIPDAISKDERLAPPEMLNGPLPLFRARSRTSARWCSTCAGRGPCRGRHRLSSRHAPLPHRAAAGQGPLHDHRPRGPGRQLRRVHLPRGLRREARDRPHLDRAARDRRPPRGPHRSHRQRDPEHLRNQYKSIEDYNRAAGEVAEPYRVLVVAFDSRPRAAKRLVSIVNSGPSCGVTCARERGFEADDAARFQHGRSRIAESDAGELDHGWRKFARPLRYQGSGAGPVPAVPRRAARSDRAGEARAASRAGRQGRGPRRGAVRLHRAEAVRVLDGVRGEVLRHPRGPRGCHAATGVLARPRHRPALIAGKTGSGKSTLLHALITNLGLMYSPDEAELYLVDFKEGVEFQWYATYRLPHARVVAIQSEREFGRAYSSDWTASCASVARSSATRDATISPGIAKPSRTRRHLASCSWWTSSRCSSWRMTSWRRKPPCCWTGSCVRAELACMCCSARKPSAERTRSPAAPSTRWPSASRCNVRMRTRR
ncbi:MAG: FtsK/SpoIIIE domain-containing protein [Gemmataceae bacterium]